ncbi:MAG: GTPase domain-containing protein [Planctomycetia bacterium]|nr:GTPase domain-containing protein [Planctomycetia bacterium]
MTPNTSADTAHQLAADLTWLEGYASQREELHSAVIPLRLSAALLRNQIAPFLNGRASHPLHIAVVGGAGTGKSTIANFLIGRSVAESNPQAGFTRHPVALVAAESSVGSVLTSGILGPLQPIAGPCPSDRDEDVFQVREVALPDSSPLEPLQHAVIWDCPDMTTWKANQYQTRLVETIGLADLVVYVASDERYNDAWPTQYLQYILQTGKPVIACLTKMQANQVDPLLKHFREQVIAQIPECIGITHVVAMPALTPSEQLDPAGVGSVHRKSVLEPVQWWLKQPHKTRLDSVHRAVRFLDQFQERLLLPAQHDLKVAQAWEQQVKTGEQTMLNRYQNEYLAGEQFPHFNIAMLKLMEMLELPGAGQYLSKMMHFLRSPYRWVKNWIQKPSEAGPQEVQILQSTFQGWLDRLRLNVIQQDQGNPVLQALRNAFIGQRESQFMEKFNSQIQSFIQQQSIETEKTARAIYEELGKQPTALNTLRGLKFSVEAASVAGVVFTAGTHFLLYPLLLPLAASLTQGLTETLGKKYVDSEREKARSRQLVVFKEILTTPLTVELLKWPYKLVPELTELKSITARLPASIHSLQQTLARQEAA